MKIKNLPLAVFALSMLSVITMKANAQTVHQLTLDEAVKLGLTNSHLIKIKKAQADQAMIATLAARQAQLPSFAVSGSYLRLTGADIKLNKNSSGTNATSGNSPNPNSALYGIANLSLPVFTGGKIKYGIEAAQFLEKASGLDVESQADLVRYNIEDAYISVYKAALAGQVVESNLKAAKQRDSTFSLLEKNGIIARNDLLKTQLQTNRLELALLETNSQHRIAMMSLDLLLGFPAGDRIEIAVEALTEVNTIAPYTNYIGEASSLRKDVQALKYRQQAGTSFIKAAKAEAYPSIALTGGYIAADIPGVITVKNAINLGVGIRYDISNLWKKNTKLQDAVAKKTVLDENAVMVDDEIIKQVSIAYEKAMLTNEKISLFQKAEMQAAENQRIVKDKYDNSLATITDLLEAEAAFFQSKLDIATAQADAFLAYKNLLLSSGISK